MAAELLRCRRNHSFPSDDDDSLASNAPTTSATGPSTPIRRGLRSTGDTHQEVMPTPLPPTPFGRCWQRLMDTNQSALTEEKFMRQTSLLLACGRLQPAPALLWRAWPTTYPARDV